MRKRGKKKYTRKEVWKILEEISADLQAKCEDNEILKVEIEEYFENFEL